MNVFCNNVLSGLFSGEEYLFVWVNIMMLLVLG